ncbi:MAG: hypothetical protein A3K59_04935 [Euryarchaeota archaeon RBG_19FT_COMBO_69_17]|nr:MAG: hypothetical protein A3K59_04935 [Euryarchaeota archaeon RBG_19FT_COMBO_69_17]
MGRRSTPGAIDPRVGGTSTEPALADEAVIEVDWPSGSIAVHGSPWESDAFAVGHLVTEGHVPSFRAIRSVTVEPEDGRVSVRVEAARGRGPRIVRRDNVTLNSARRSLGRSIPPGERRIEPEDLLSLARFLAERERDMRAAGPLHWAVLYDPASGEAILASDLSRHSAMDKVVGKALLSDVPVAGRILYSTGRLGEEMAAKAVRVGAGALATRSVAFRPAVDLARAHGLVLVGRLLPGGFLPYAGPALFLRRSRRTRR